MGQPNVLAAQGATQDISRDQWIPFLLRFAELSDRFHQDSVVAQASACRVETRLDPLFARLKSVGMSADAAGTSACATRPFDGISADVKDGEDVVWMLFGSTPEDRLAHGIPKVTMIKMRLPTGRRGAALEVDSEDGTRTLLELSRPEEYALPPAIPRNS